jgi:putative FmdB family regulatory protein
MPIFEYTCKKCGRIFEKLVLGRNGGEIVCPKCGSARVEQMFSAFATASASPKSAGVTCGPAGGG